MNSAADVIASVRPARSATPPGWLQRDGIGLIGLAAMRNRTGTQNARGAVQRRRPANNGGRLLEGCKCLHTYSGLPHLMTALSRLSGRRDRVLPILLLRRIELTLPLHFSLRSSGQLNDYQCCREIRSPAGRAGAFSTIVAAYREEKPKTYIPHITIEARKIVDQRVSGSSFSVATSRHTSHS